MGNYRLKCLFSYRYKNVISVKYGINIVLTFLIRIFAGIQFTLVIFEYRICITNRRKWYAPQSVVCFSALFCGMRVNSGKHQKLQRRWTCVPMHILITTTISSTQQTTIENVCRTHPLPARVYWTRSPAHQGEIPVADWPGNCQSLDFYYYYIIPFLLHCVEMRLFCTTTTNIWQSLTRFYFNYSCRARPKQNGK